MSCYTRHLTGLLADLGFEDTRENRKLLDKAIRKAFGTEDLHCPEVWKDVKARRETREFANAVAAALRQA